MGFERFVADNLLGSEISRKEQPMFTIGIMMEYQELFESNTLAVVPGFLKHRILWKSRLLRATGHINQT